MSGLDIFAWVVLVVLIATVIVGFVVLAMLPGKVAKERGHPQQEAINVAGWLGALFGGVFWPLALIWAFTKSPNFDPLPPEPSEGEAKGKDTSEATT